MTRSIPILLAVPLAWLVVCSVEAQRAASPAGTAGPPVRLQGRVLEADTVATPVPRARITITPRDGTESAPVFADASGRFEISVPASPSYTVSMAKAGFGRQTVPLTTQNAMAPLELRLVRAGVITGSVVDGGGRPVVAAGIRVRRVDVRQAPLASAETDDLGAYRIPGLAPGRYEVQMVLRAPGARTTSARNPSARPGLSEAVVVDVTSGEEQTVWLTSPEPATILPYAVVGGAVSGTVRDPSGEPLEGLHVQLWSVRFTNGRLTARREQSRTTDERGRYRLFHIPAGRYVIAAADDPQRLPSSPGASFIPVYYPGRDSIAEATPVEVGRSQQFAGIDIVFAERSGARVSGIVTNAAGQPISTRVSLTVSHRSGAVATPPHETSSNARGEFELRHVPPGDYVIRTRPSPAIIGTRTVFVPAPGPTPPAGAGSRGGGVAIEVPVLEDTPREYAMQYVAVGASDPLPLLLQTAQRVAARGRVVFEDGPPPRTSSVRVGAVAADPDLTPDRQSPMTRATRDGDWAFTMQDLLGPMRVTLADVPPGWWLRTITIGRANITDAAVDFGRGPAFPGEITLVLANTAAALEGRAIDERGAPGDEYWAIAFPLDTRRWYPGSPYVKNVYVRPDGRYLLESMPPGDYWVTAVDLIEDDSTFGEWQSAESLSRLIPVARQVSLGERERVTVDLRLTRMPRF